MTSESPTFDERVPTLAPLAYRVCFRILGDRTEAQDLTQEALARTYARWSRVGAYDEAWITRVATNLALGEARRRARRRRGGAAEADSMARATGRADSGHETAVVQRAELVAVLRSLPRRQRQVVALRYLADLPEAQVAAALGCSTGTVKQHASRGLRALRAGLGPGLVDADADSRHEPGSKPGASPEPGLGPRHEPATIRDHALGSDRAPEPRSVSVAARSPMMLDQLDDPVPFSASPELVARARARGRQIRWRRRLTLGGAAIPVLVVVALLAAATYVDRRVDQVDRVDMASGSLVPVVAGRPFDVLVVGVDGPRLDQPDPVADQRTDTMLVVRVDPSAGSAQVLALPRDLVPADATSGDDRLNGALARGGPDALVRAVHDELGLAVAHYVQIDFQGFVRLADTAGGVSVQATAPLRDPQTGLSLDGTCQHLDGEELLGLVRARHLERFQDGRWVTNPGGDLTRVALDQSLLPLLVGRLADLPTDPTSLDRLLDVVADNTTVDAGLDRSTLLTLAGVALRLTPDTVHSATLPVVPATVGGAVVLRPAPEATDTVAAFERGELPTPSGAVTPSSAQPLIAGC